MIPTGQTRPARWTKDPAVLNANYASGGYWNDRLDMMYYRYVDFIVRTVGADAQRMIDIGTAQCPYLEWFDWIPFRVSFDLETPYRSDTVKGVKGNFLDHKFQKRFDILTCLQVMEHVPEPRKFARKLLQTADTVVVSVPYEWGAGVVPGHVNDPVSKKSLKEWFGRWPNYSVIVAEPFRSPKRLIAVFDKDPKRAFGKRDAKARVRRGFDGVTQPPSIG